MKKHAYLIMAHNNFDLLQKELYLLDDERNDIFIHIDKKAKNVDQAYITEKVKHSNVYFLPRISINWGGYSIAQCTVELLKKAIETDVYKYSVFCVKIRINEREIRSLLHYFLQRVKVFSGFIQRYE